MFRDQRGVSLPVLSFLPSKVCKFFVDSLESHLELDKDPEVR